MKIIFVLVIFLVNCFKSLNMKKDSFQMTLDGKSKILQEQAQDEIEQTPPKLQDIHGFNIGNQNSQQHMEIFIDLLEKSGVDTFFGLLEATKTKYMNNDGPIFKMTVHIMPQPQNINSYEISKLSKLFSSISSEAFQGYVKLIMHNQAIFENIKTRKMTQDEVEDEIAEVLMQGLKKLKTKFSRNDVIQAFHNPEYDQEMFNDIQYTLKRGVFYFPYFMANGVEIEKANEFKQAQWEEFLCKFCQNNHKIDDD